MKKRLLALLLSLLMLFSLLPTAAFAAVRDEDALSVAAPAAEEDNAAATAALAVVEDTPAVLAADLPETPNGNLCRPSPSDGVTVTATASSNETAHVTPDKAIDGGFTNSAANNANVERWASSTGTAAQWLQINLGTLRTVSVVKIFWQHDSVTAYNVQVSADGTDWKTVYDHSSGRITQLDKTITFDPQACQYIKITATAYDSNGSANWNNVSIWEVEAYRDEKAIPQTPSNVLGKLLTLEGGPLTVNADKTKVVLTDAAAELVPEDFTVTFAANLEQVVGEGGVIYTPIVDKQVAFDITVTDAEGTTATSPANSPIQFIVPGTHTPAESTGNAKPAVIPDIMEWYSDSTGKFRLTENSRIIHRYGANGDYNEVANQLTADVKELFGIELKHVHTAQTYEQILNELKPGDIIIYNVLDNGIVSNRDMVNGFDNETYRMDVSDVVHGPDGSIVKTGVPHVTIYARGIDANGNGVDGSTGAYWATRTLLQGMLLNEDEEGNYFPYGVTRDYPEFKVRGFMLDVGRKPMSMDMLQNFVKNMAWYKLNDFHVHLSDNLIFMEDYCAREDRNDYESAYEAYSAFRMESSVQEEPGAKPLTAQDYAYTKAEFKEFVKDSALLGVNIVPEFDVPAHAKAFTDAFPSLRLNKTGKYGGTPRRPWIDHLDLTNKMDESIAKLEEIFDEYLDGDDPVFAGEVFHFGADEYYDGTAAYAPFARAMVDYVLSKGKTPRFWGSLTSMGDPDHLFTPELAEKVQMNIWSTGWATPRDMYNLGFSLINITDSPAYMVPNGGGGRGAYGDYLNLTEIYNWAPNCIKGTWFPASSKQILGSAFAIWNDNIDTQASGLDEVDSFVRFLDTLPVIAVRQWGVENNTPARSLAELQADAAITGIAPQSNPLYKVDETDYFAYTFTDGTDVTGNGHDLTLHNATIQGGVLSLKGGSSYAETGLDRLPWGSQLNFRAKKLEGGGNPQIIFAGDHAYGDFIITALPVSGNDTKWKLGFSRELYDYEFNVELPVGEWVDLTIINDRQSTKLIYNDQTVTAVGKFVSKPDSNTQFRGKTGINNSSFELPVARIGSKANAFKGLLDNISVGEKLNVPNAFLTATAPSELKNPSGSGVVEGPASYAVDGDLNTMWHSNWGADAADNPNDLSDKPEKRYIQLNLAYPSTVSGLTYTPRSGAGNGTVTQYRIEVSTDGETFTSVKSGEWAQDETKKTASFTPQNNIVAVRLYGEATVNNNANQPANKFMTAVEVGLVYDPIVLTDSNTTITVDNITWGANAVTAEITVALQPSGLRLSEGTDYTMTYSNNTNPAGGAVTVTITGTGGYTGTVSATFTAPAKPAVADLSAATVTFDQASYPLVDGKATPDPKVVLNGVTLLRGLDYDVTYTNNTRTGTATATITGIGTYTGTVSKTFAVTAAVAKKNLNDSNRTKVTLHQLDFIYTGKPITPEPVVTYDGEILVKDVHYTILRYSRNTAVGTATVTVKGIAPYCEGTATATFEIINPTASNDLSDVHLTEVIFNPTEYEYTGKPITPTFTVLYNGVLLVEGVDYTVTLSKNVIVGNGLLVIRGIGNYYGSYSASFEIIPDKDGNTGAGSGSTGTGGGSSGGGSTGSSSSGGGSTGGSSSKTKGDGVTTTVKTDSSGAMSVQSNYDDGTTVSADIPVTGPVTAEVTVPPKKDSVTVTIPTREKPTAGHIVVIIHPDGTEEIVKTALPTEDGMEVTLSDSALVQVVDNTKTFIDVPRNSWANEAITFVTAREIFNGTGNNTFTPAGNMSRAMVCTVLANLAGVETKGGATWYDKALSWAQEEGVSDGTSPHAVVTREQLAVMLYRYAGSPTVTDEVPRRFRDRDSISDWAELAMTWAVENDLIRGRSNAGGLDLAPQDTASRAEVAAVFQRYVALLK